jgi:hypothetical protein
MIQANYCNHYNFWNRGLMEHSLASPARFWFNMRHVRKGELHETLTETNCGIRVTRPSETQTVYKPWTR